MQTELQPSNIWSEQNIIRFDKTTTVKSSANKTQTDESQGRREPFPKRMYIYMYIYSHEKSNSAQSKPVIALIGDSAGGAGVYEPRPCRDSVPCAASRSLRLVVVVASHVVVILYPVGTGFPYCVLLSSANMATFTYGRAQSVTPLFIPRFLLKFDIMCTTEARNAFGANQSLLLRTQSA